jgi:YVTN family beta-propeller protein
MKLKPWLAGVPLLVAATAIAQPAAPNRVLPGLQPDGAVLLHNQWPIRPVGRQVELGDFPVNMAVDPSGRYAAVVHAGRTAHQIRVIDLRTGAGLKPVDVHQAFYGIAFSADGKQLVCSGGTDDVLRVFDFRDGQLSTERDVKLAVPVRHNAVGGIALAPDGATAFASVLFASRVAALNLKTGATLWTTALDAQQPPPPAGAPATAPSSPNDLLEDLRPLVVNADPLALVFDAGRNRVYASLWGSSEVAVLEAGHGSLIARWPVRLHPNEMVLAPDGSRLFVSNGGRNSVTVLDANTGGTIETLSSAIGSDDLPGSTPDSLALSRDGKCLFAANAYNNNVAVFDVSVSGKGRALGFIPTGWFPTSVRLTPDDRHLLVVSARGLEPRPNNLGETTNFTFIGELYHGSLGIVDLPPVGLLDRLLSFLDIGDLWARPAFGQAMARWTALAELCHPAPAAPVAAPDNPIPARRGGKTPIRYVIYVIKENRTYDQVFGDMAEGNGDPNLCLFPESVTPNIHKIAREFTLFDNFYANAEVSASGHEWSMAAYDSEFVERIWPVTYNHSQHTMIYPAEGRYAAAVPALGYIWDRAEACGLTYRDYGEFVVGAATREDPATSNMPALVGHVDPFYRGWDLDYADTDRAARFISELRRFESAGDMPRLQIVRLPNDHTAAARAGSLTPRAMVALNDLALGQIVDAVTKSRFWPQTAMFIVEDDAQNGPDHVDAHRTEALVVSPYTRRHFVDSTPYTTCSMLSTMEFLLGMAPLSQFDDAAAPMRNGFRGTPDLAVFDAVPERIDMTERNKPNTRAAAISSRMNFTRADANDDQLFNRVLWAAVRGEGSAVPAPVHAAFVRPMPDDDD